MNDTQSTTEKAIENTAHLKHMAMIVGTEGIKNFFVLHETELVQVGIKLTAESGWDNAQLCLRVRIVPKQGTVVSMAKLYEDTFKEKMEQCEHTHHVKYNPDRISFIIHSEIMVDDTTIFTTEVDDVVKDLLNKTIIALNTVFDMTLDRKGFRPVLHELCAMGLPKGVQELSGMPVEGVAQAGEDKTGSVTSIDKNKDK